MPDDTSNGPPMAGLSSSSRAPARRTSSHASDSVGTASPYSPAVTTEIASVAVDQFSLNLGGKGVVAVVSPWNFPLAIPCGGVAAAALRTSAFDQHAELA